MNYSTNLLNYLSRSEDSCEILLSPGAPPVAKKNSGLEIVANAIVSPQDIRETLSTFHSHTRGAGASPIGTYGVFSFGMPNLGRFRVHYFTQRGSHVVSVRRVPLAVPDLKTLVEDPASLKALDELTARRDSGLVLVTSASADRNIEFAYAWLKRISESVGRIVYILEEDLSFLMKHEKSIVIQSEVNTDIGTLAEGIRNGLMLAPDIMYVRNPRLKEEIIGLMQAAEAGSLVVISVVAFNEKALLMDFEARLTDFYDNFCALMKTVIRVSPANGGKLTFQILEGPWSKGGEPRPAAP